MWTPSAPRRSTAPSETSRHSEVHAPPTHCARLVPRSAWKHCRRSHRQSTLRPPTPTRSLRRGWRPFFGCSFERRRTRRRSRQRSRKRRPPPAADRRRLRNCSSTPLRRGRFRRCRRAPTEVSRTHSAVRCCNTKCAPRFSPSAAHRRPPRSPPRRKSDRCSSASRSAPQATRRTPSRSTRKGRWRRTRGRDPPSTTASSGSRTRRRRGSFSSERWISWRQKAAWRRCCRTS
mmetsp:Transcript_39613/g.122485  ORF Transcript_39613/g.122485 Transcript_39613/m.122485 type:complete len:232 (-) Transcript_39613:2014-2709(-)